MRDTARFPPISDEYAAAIGNVAYHWSLVEGQLAHMIGHLLGLHRMAGHAVTADMAMLGRLNLARTLIDLTGDATLIAGWSALEKDINAARIERNDIVHGEWTVSGRDHSRIRVKAKGKITISRDLVPIEQLAALSPRLWNLTERIANFGIDAAIAKAPSLINRESPPGYRPQSQALAQAQAQTPSAPGPNRIPKGRRKAARKRLLADREN